MHELYLIKKTETQDDSFFQYFYRNRDKYKDIIIDYTTLDVNVYDYIFESLTWIPSANPAFPGRPKDMGFHTTGITLFDENSASSLCSIFTAWRDLFKNGPSKIRKLMYSEEDNVGFDRDYTIKELERIIDFSKRLSSGEYYLYHAGI